MNKMISKTSAVKVETIVKATHYKPNSLERVNYDEFSHHRCYGKSVTDKSLYVPLSVQVAEMLGKVKNGLGSSSSVAIHTDKDYTFPDGKTGVDTWKPSPLLDRGLDIAEISEFKRLLEAEVSKVADAQLSDAQLELINKTKAQIKASHAVDAEALKQLGSFGDLIEKYNASVTSKND